MSNHRNPDFMSASISQYTTVSNNPEESNSFDNNFRSPPIDNIRQSDDNFFSDFQASLDEIGSHPNDNIRQSDDEIFSEVEASLDEIESYPNDNIRQSDDEIFSEVEASLDEIESHPNDSIRQSNDVILPGVEASLDEFEINNGQVITLGGNTQGSIPESLNRVVDPPRRNPSRHCKVKKFRIQRQNRRQPKNTKRICNIRDKFIRIWRDQIKIYKKSKENVKKSDCDKILFNLYKNLKKMIKTPSYKNIKFLLNGEMYYTKLLKENVNISKSFISDMNYQALQNAIIKYFKSLDSCKDNCKIVHSDHCKTTVPLTERETKSSYHSEKPENTKPIYENKIIQNLDCSCNNDFLADEDKNKTKAEYINSCFICCFCHLNPKKCNIQHFCDKNCIITHSSECINILCNIIYKKFTFKACCSKEIHNESCLSYIESCFFNDLFIKDRCHSS